MEKRLGILERVIQPATGNLQPDLARYILTLGFPEVEKQKYLELADKAQTGNLSVEETAELDDFLEVNAFLTVIQAKARRSLQRAPAA